MSWVTPQQFAAQVIRNVCELPDYTSPDNQPDLLQCTVSELEACILSAFEQFDQTHGTPSAVETSALLAKLDELGKLQQNWDSYGALPLHPQCVAKAREIGASLPDPDKWSAVPMCNGGVQIEQHRGGLDIELVIEKASERCQHDLQLPGNTIVLTDDNSRAVCVYCAQEWLNSALPQNGLANGEKG